MRTVIFHGTSLPDRDWAGGLEADVVLQPYHAIVQAQGYAEWFPRARRFVYVNPTAVDRVRRADVTNDMVFSDPHDRWNLPRLRLPRCLDWAVSDAVDIGRETGVDGLFVDDLDRLLATPAERDVAISYVHRITHATGGTLYVNRAFAILDALPSLEAVLVEDLDRNPDSPGTAVWMDAVVLPALNRARDRGVRVHRLDYRIDAKGGAEAGTYPLDAGVDSIARLPDPCLDRWSWWRECEPVMQTLLAHMEDGL